MTKSAEAAGPSGAPGWIEAGPSSASTLGTSAGAVVPAPRTYRELAEALNTLRVSGYTFSSTYIPG